MTEIPFPAALTQMEPRPRDFTGKFARGGRRHARRRLRRRWALGAGALAAVALPAVAEPGNWDRFTIADARSGDGAVLPMPFEQPGSSFPGSAYYYLQPEPAVETDDASAALPADPSGPVARAFRFVGTELDRARAQQCMTMAIYYEAATEPDAGQRAVAQVVLNRLAHPAYPKTVCGVVFQGSERPTGCQFTFACDGSLARAPQRFFWDRAAAVARAALAGYVYAPVGLATHYHTIQINPYWAPTLHYLTTIGAHRFYSFEGAAGAPAAFRLAYLGGEPMAAPRPRDLSAASAMADAALDPVALQRAFATAPTAPPPAESDAAPAPSPAPRYTQDVRGRGGDAIYRAQGLPEAQGIRPEYANSGKWIAAPGT
ncbi:cell wall hydrolase [Novosphingobium sp. PhB165]|uniref:cell wall hydrolase n=1 Tax=Novosphingobium sp. PhB165 TaxID=2485105 RepID=UPI0010EDC372|nr:cell wall hydrolase [Novosphingobium sp. PhB165]TCM22260.1 cell wall hydrolase [Novosphingobium sp. PhB165]